MRKKLLSIIAFLFLLFPASEVTSAALKELDIDGSNWVEMTYPQKHSFLIGWARGSKIAAIELRSRLSPIEEWRQTDDILDKVLKYEGFDFDEASASQIIETISFVYSDPRVKKWEIHRIMPLVHGRLIDGWTIKDLDEVIAYRLKMREFWKIPRDLWPAKPKVLEALEAGKFDLRKK